MWPKNLALVLSAIDSRRRHLGRARGVASPRQAARRGQLQTRREKLFSELASLEAQRRARQRDAGAYASRRADLVTSLEGVYAELE